ncbi:MAG: coniferyl aldehyde dehydrogenase [Endozoicomonadaceae bacterium]|nr:coniferyl aldehyde dehydrogenase [Endozoicomonadaceae bacterium]
MAATAEYLQTSEKDTALMQSVLAAQQKAYRSNPMPAVEERIANLKKLKHAILSHQHAIIEAINKDFAGRSRNETLFAEIMPIAQGINDTIKRVRQWMKPSRRRVGHHLQPGCARVVYQPLGVIGIMVPWNYPMQLSVLPLVGALAAGNCVMIKMSEFTPNTAECFARIMVDTFPTELVAVLNGDAEMAAAFSTLPLDHLLFTGSAQVGRRVMRAAAENLTPVTLELGGKSPAIIGEDIPLEDAVERICFGKSINAGQTCVAPDYVLCPRDKQDAFIEIYRKVFNRMYPQLEGNQDYTSIVNERQQQRLQQLVIDARSQGATVDVIGENSIADGSRRMPLHILTNVSDEMLVMQEEIFGPVMPVVPYDSLAEALEFVRDRPRPLALYYFSYDKLTQEYVLNTTHSGGVCINDTLLHVVVDDIPFGGIGPSGMGHYHGHDGFLTFSKAKGVLIKQTFNVAKFIYPPYGGKLQQLIQMLFIR